MKYGLIGNNLIHSYSKTIHNYINKDYELKNISNDDLKDFMLLFHIKKK